MTVDIPPADMLMLTEAIAEAVTGERPRGHWVDIRDVLEIFALSRPRTDAAMAAMRVWDRITEALHVAGPEPEPVIDAAAVPEGCLF